MVEESDLLGQLKVHKEQFVDYMLCWCFIMNDDLLF